MILFPFNENQFSFFVADNLLVGQLCTNPKSDKSLLSYLKVTQCSTSEIEDALLYNSCSLPIQVMTMGPLPAASKCKSGLPRITGICPGWWKQSFWPLTDPPPPPPTWTHWTTSFGHHVENLTNMTSHNTKTSLIAAMRRVFT